MRRRWTAIPVILLLGGAVAAETERAMRLKIDFGGSIPEAEEGQPPPKPVFVYVASETPTRDQARFEEVVLANETFSLAAKFFDAVRMTDAAAREHELLKGLRFAAPSVIVFDSTREKRLVADGRASAMKIYQLFVKIGQEDWETDVAKTVREARNLLATFDQIDAARDALGIKRTRVAEAQADGNTGRASMLGRECEKEQAEIDAMFLKAEEQWTKIWDLKRKLPKKDEGEKPEK